MNEFAIGRRVKVVGNGYHYTGQEGRLVWRKPADPKWTVDFGGNGTYVLCPSFVESELELLPDDEPQGEPIADEWLAKINATVEKAERDRLDPNVPKLTLPEAFKALREASGGRWEGVTDAAAYVRELRDGDECEAKPEPAVDHGYYHAGDLEAIEVARKVFTATEIAAWGKIAAWLYLWRDGKKAGTDDVRKAYEHLGMILEAKP